MDLLADESVDFGLVCKLRENGFVVLSVMEDFPGISDKEVLQIANEKQYLLVTEDKDFGELAYRLKLDHHGIFLIRLSNIPRTDRIQFAYNEFSKHHELLYGKFTVLTNSGIRIKTAKNK